MSIKYLNTAFHARVGNHLRKLILIFLADKADDRGYSYYSKAKIAAACECDEASVRRHLRALEADGYVHSEPRFINGAQISSGYWLCNPEDLDDRGEADCLGGEAETPWGGGTVPHNTVNEPSINISIAGWDEWVAYRAEIKKKMSPSTIKKQVKFLEQKPPAEQQAIIDQSIQNGWTGLFNLKEKSNGQNRTDGKPHSRGVTEVRLSAMFDQDNDIIG